MRKILILAVLVIVCSINYGELCPMTTLNAPEAAVVESQENLPDFSTAAYKDAYSRINAIVIEGEQEAHDNYIALGSLIPEHADQLKRLARMEMKHMKGFTSCGRNLGVVADISFAKKFFEPLHSNFQTAFNDGKVVTCLLIQALMIEAFAISAYHIYIPVADPYARKITEGVVKDEYLHLNYGQEWLKANFEASKEEMFLANKANLPLIRKMLEQVSSDAAVLHMEKEDLIEDFLIAYQEALNEIGFTSREIAKLAAAALAG